MVVCDVDCASIARRKSGREDRSPRVAILLTPIFTSSWTSLYIPPIRSTPSSRTRPDFVGRFTHAHRRRHSGSAFAFDASTK
eukprot:2992215-Pleurochrysis_carterae.AAC.1